MCEVLKLILQGKSCYAIARELDMDPPSIYVSYHAAKENLPKIDKMLTELKALGWQTNSQKQKKISAQKAHEEGQKEP